VDACAVREDRQIVQRITIDQQQVGQFSGLDAAEVVLRTNDLGVGPFGASEENWVDSDTHGESTQ
jgi:hypothetical protein